MPRNWDLERYPGKCVAIDMKTDEVVLTAGTPQELEADIKAKSLKHVATMHRRRTSGFSSAALNAAVE